ncbi:MAG TPA: nucleotidyl transferase AbiEii/AbiGii toxin family protein [Candidatus Hydrogenedentes bacterium]|nr:nucleotidyl transferase AbiEii/AbiGii toxin family protein [Candidatus Hydrogenedentota bacterium]
MCEQTKPSLFAGKVHALLCREYVKGRDWYDFIWYTSLGAGINHEFLTSAIAQAGPWKNQGIQTTSGWVVSELEKKILSINWKHALKEVRPFIRANEQPSLDLWSTDLFLHQLNKWKQGNQQSDTVKR